MGRRIVVNQTGYRGSLADRFWRKVIRAGNDECWLWIGSIDRRGYGQIRMPGKGRLRRATHVSLELVERGPVPDGMLVMHTCDNPPCVNPAHLLIGTQFDNQQDSVKKGRHSKPPPSTIGRGRKEFCRRGHPLSGDNLYIWPKDGGRSCRACMRINKIVMRKRFLAQGLRSDGVPRKYPLVQANRSDDEGA